MRRVDHEKSMRDLINQMLRAYGLGNQLDEIGLVKSWEEVVGKMVAKHTKDIYFKKGIFYVSLDSAALRQQMSYNKSKIVELLNNKAGKDLVKELVLR